MIETAARVGTCKANRIHTFGANARARLCHALTPMLSECPFHRLDQGSDLHDESNPGRARRNTRDTAVCSVKNPSQTARSAATLRRRRVVPSGVHRPGKFGGEPVLRCGQVFGRGVVVTNR